MKEQIEYLCEVNQLSFVTISVLPLSVGAHSSMTGAFVVLAFDETEPDVVYIESRDGNRYESSPTTLSLYRGDIDQTDTITEPLEEFVK